MAPPSKLTPEIQERICTLIRAGNTIETAAEASGITRGTFYAWKAKRPAFQAAVEQAEAEAESILVTRIAKAAQSGSWRAAAWLLERSSPEQWGRERTSDVERPKTVFEGLYEVGTNAKTRRGA